VTTLKPDHPEASIAPLPVWVCNLRRTLLGGPLHRQFLEIRITCYRQLPAMRVSFS
jgi:hypothetical protein